MINFAKIWDILITKFPAFMEGVEITLQLAFFTVLFGSRCLGWWWRYAAAPGCFPCGG